MEIFIYKYLYINMDIEKILSLEGILLNNECVICFNKFINIKDRDYYNFYDKIKEKYHLQLSPRFFRKFEENTTCMCYDARNECLICKNSVCYSCLDKQDDPFGEQQLNNAAMFVNGYTEEVYEKLFMADTGIIKCPICQTIDYRQKISNKEPQDQWPPEILYDIKKHLKN